MVLAVLQRYADWVDIGLVVSQELISLLYQLLRGAPPTASRILVIISNRDPENIPEYSEFLCLYHWRPPLPLAFVFIPLFLARHTGAISSGARTRAPECTLVRCTSTRTRCNIFEGMVSRADLWWKGVDPVTATPLHSRKPRVFRALQIPQI